jgi:hypothetical protein
MEDLNMKPKKASRRKKQAYIYVEGLQLGKHSRGDKGHGPTVHVWFYDGDKKCLGEIAISRATVSWRRKRTGSYIDVKSTDLDEFFTFWLER